MFSSLILSTDNLILSHGHNVQYDIDITTSLCASVLVSDLIKQRE